MGQTESVIISTGNQNEDHNENGNEIIKQVEKEKSESTIPVTDNVNHKSSSFTSMEALVAEATAKGSNNENESLEVIAQQALECPCLDELRDGPCGGTFAESFKCYIKSSAAEKGSDCVKQFIAFQACIEENPGAFGKYDLHDRDITDGDNARQEEKNSSS